MCQTYTKYETVGYQVFVTQAGRSVSFDFAGLGEAMSFASTCMECGTDSTIISVSEVREKEE